MAHRSLLNQKGSKNGKERRKESSFLSELSLKKELKRESLKKKSESLEKEERNLEREREREENQEREVQTSDKI